MKIVLPNSGGERVVERFSMHVDRGERVNQPPRIVLVLDGVVGVGNIVGPAEVKMSPTEWQAIQEKGQKLMAGLEPDEREITRFSW